MYAGGILKKQALIKREDGQTIDAMHYGKAGSKSIIIFVHGFPKAQVQENNFFGFLAEEIPSYGASTLLFDYSSCNYKSGETENFCFQSAGEDLEAVYKWVTRMGYDHIGIITEGLGSALVLSFPPKSCTLSIFCWPCFDTKHACDHLFKTSQHQATLEEEGWLDYSGVKIGQKFIDDLGDQEMIEHMNSFTAPSLILFGEKDDLFPETHINLARNHLMASRLEITSLDGAEHGLQRSTDRKCCMMHINQFLTRYIEH